MLWQYIKENMMYYPDKTISENGGGMNFDDLIAYAEAFGQNLRGKKCCAIYCRSEMAAAMALLACLSAEVTAVPLSEKYGALYCKKILNMISPDCVITDSHGNIKVFDIPSAEYSEPDIHPALIMCTSGTTGEPKGAMLTENNLMTNIRGIRKYFRISDKDRILIARPLYHCAVLTGEFLVSLTTGTDIEFYSEKLSPVSILDKIIKEKITVFGATPTIFSLLSELAVSKNNVPLKKMVISGECMSSAVGKRIRNAFPKTEIYHVYGMTEASPRISYLPPEEFDMTPDSVGIPLESLEIKILDENGNKVKNGVPGILYVKGDSVMNGYYNSPELTEKTITDGWLRTGDIAELNENGRLKIIGRSDDMIIRAGINIYPQEIEAELKKDPRTKEVLVYGIKKSNRISTLIGMKIAGDFSDEKEVKAMCIKSLPGFQVPDIIEIVGSIEKNGSGKIIRKKE